MKKIFIGIIVSAVALIGYIAATSIGPQPPSEIKTNVPVLSVEKTTINYDDIQNWTAKLQPGTSYVVTLRPVASPTIFILGSGNADPNGDASGAFLVARNLPAGAANLRVEVGSDSSIFDEKPFTISETRPSIVVTVASSQVNYGGIQSWEARGLPPNASYVVTLRSLTNPVVFILGSGNANADGETSGAFVVEGNVPSGVSAFRVELASDPSVYSEKLFIVGEISPSISVSVASLNVNFGDTQSWEAKGLLPDVSYVVTLRSLTNPVVVLLGSGTANADGEASGAFVPESNIPAGEYALHVELESLPPYFGEATFTVG